jgi:hypothetical protein
MIAEIKQIFDYRYQDLFSISVETVGREPQKARLNPSSCLNKKSYRGIYLQTIQTFKTVFPVNSESVNESINPYFIMTRHHLDLKSGDSPYFFGTSDFETVCQGHVVEYDKDSLHRFRFTYYRGVQYPRNGLSSYFTILDALEILVRQGILVRNWDVAVIEREPVSSEIVIEI